MFASKDTLLTRPSGGYTIARSVRIRSSAQGYFSKTLTTPTNNKKWTYSVWMKRGSLSANRTIMSSNVDGAEYWDMRFNTSDQIFIQNRVGSSNLLLANTTAVYRDPSAWYHIVFIFDSDNATAANRNLLYVNGVNVSLSANSGSGNASAWNTSGIQHNIGVSRTLTSGGGIWAEFDGYETEINFIDGQALTPSSFGETDSITGVWKPKAYSGTYGTNGFELNFSDNSNNTAATIGKDYSGNGNNWTPNNISVTTGATYDSMVDSPTVGATSSNYAVLNPVTPSTYRTLSNGNLRATGNTAANSGMSVSSIGVSTGKIVWEETINTVSGNFPGIGATTVIPSDGNGQNPAASNTLGIYYRANGDIYKNSATLVGSYTTLSATNVVRFELDADALTCSIYRNNTLVVTVTGLTAGTFYPSNVQYNGSISDINFGQQSFVNTPNSGFVALNTYNLPASTIKNGAAYMAATTYTGNGSTQSISNAVNGVSFQPDWLWVKERSEARSNLVWDSVRGSNLGLITNTTSAESAQPSFTGFLSNGFGVSNTDLSDITNKILQTYVGWAWKANGTAVTNTAGTISSQVSAGATQGFSVVTYTGTGATATVGHGLGVTPSMIIVKDRSAATNWAVYHTSLGANSVIFLNATNASTTVSGKWGTPNSTTFGINTAGDLNASGESYVAYCFAAVAGYSAFGSYTGNGSTDGPFIYTGFRPRFVMTKRTDTTSNWYIQDTSRSSYNLQKATLFAESSAAEAADGGLDFLSNGFKLRNTDSSENASGGTYIYMAFCESPFKTSLAR